MVVHDRWRQQTCHQVRRSDSNSFKNYPSASVNGSDSILRHVSV